MSTPTILVIGTVSSSVMRCPSPSVHITPEGTPTLPRTALWTLGGGSTPAQIPTVVSKTATELAFSDTDTLGSATDKGTPF